MKVDIQNQGRIHGILITSVCGVGLSRGGGAIF